MGKYESPSYQLLEQDGKYEIRHYNSFYTSSINERSLSGRSGFGVLFSYISGQNEDRKKIAMTVPVINELKDDMTMEFVVPNDLRERIPLPRDERLRIKHHPESKQAVFRFRGFTNTKKIEKLKRTLSRWIQEKGYIENGYFLLARYNPPFVPPCFRRNELMIAIKIKANSK